MVSSAKTVDEFLATLRSDERAVFAKIRALFLRYAPGTESMQYRMPGYAVGGFNRQKHYLALYITPEAVDPHRAELKKLGLDCGKCCIRFRKPGDLPLALAEKLIKGAAKLAKKKPA
jgi:uncharacterized protein YdhG (YjbR/CyaY superfamily)